MFDHTGGQTITLVSADRLEWVDDASGMLLWDLVLTGLRADR
ncbi:MAG: hypothetical protein RIB46_12420 [Pseudomonadales bacterium]